MEEKPQSVAVRKSQDFSEWYTQVLIKSGFVDYTAVSGALAYRPDSYFVWETIQRATDDAFREAQIHNVYFPLFIPERLLEKEKEHVKGFSPEVAWVTHAGDSKLDERLAVRPTSETIMYDSYSKWIRSWRDLPMRYNQWNNVVRWEFRHPMPFIRGREFLWNEGHTAFATKEEADGEREFVLGTYLAVLKDYLALPGIAGRKTDTEKFAGAEASYSIEMLMPDLKVVQGPDFHSDGQNFAKAFNITFVDKDEKRKHVYQNTFAISTRVIGVMVAVHGDDRGLVLPPSVAATQVVIIPIYRDDNKKEVLDYCGHLYKTLRESFRTFVDVRDAYTPGWKFNDAELRGVPLRLEVGAREMAAQGAVAVRRDTGEKVSVKLDGIVDRLVQIMDAMHEDMYRKATEFYAANTHKVSTYDQLKKTLADIGGIMQAPWCGSADCEAKVKEETGAKATNMPFDAQGGADKMKCIYCGKEARHIVNFAKSY